MSEANNALKFTIGPVEPSGKRLVRAFQGDLLLAQEKFDVFQSWQAKQFLQAVTSSLPNASKFESFEDALSFVRDGFGEAVRSAASTADAGDKPARKPIIQSLSDVEPEEVSWLWPGRIALGKVTMIAGDPGLGKSFLSLDIAARVSTGASWPDSDECAPHGGVVVLTCEDGLADTIRPRLDAAGADVRRIIALQGVAATDDEGSYQRGVDLSRDLSTVEAAIDFAPDCRLLIVDPFPAFLGKTDSHKNAEVRSVIAPLAELAERRQFAVLGITHLSKSERQAIYRCMGSLAFAAAARAVWAVTKDARDEEKRRRLFLPIKNNLGNDLSGLSFTLATKYGDGGVPCVAWSAEPVDDVTADESLTSPTKPRGRPAEGRDSAVWFLQQALANGPRPANDIKDEATNGHLISARSLDRAKAVLGVECYRERIPGPWVWRLPTLPKTTLPKASRGNYGDVGNVANFSGKTPDSTTPKPKNAKIPVCEENGLFNLSNDVPDCPNHQSNGYYQQGF
ncbi:MAG: AAA family ATPase [Pirellulales bacterium]|nr:AAA family ATPase [Pirellulales bacterium]